MDPHLALQEVQQGFVLAATKIWEHGTLRGNSY